jgi:hypothetical protein
VSRTYNTHIAPRVLDLCQQPRTVAEIEDEFRGTERHLARFAVYNLVKRGQLRNLTQGKCGNGKVGRFVATSGVRPPVGDGSALAAAWGLMR